MDFKTRFKLLRAESRMSAEQVGNLIGASKSTISYWENGKYQPSNDVLIKIANVFNVSTDYLLGVSDYRNKVGYKIACSDYDQLNDTNKEIIDDLAAKLLKGQDK